MTDISYDDSPYPVRDDLADSHRRAWSHMSAAGSWLTGEQRLKIAAETRHARTCPTCARIKEALSPFAVTDAHDAGTDLPESWINMIHMIVADPGRLTRGWYDRIRASGIEEGQFVEIVSMVAHITSIDTFAKGLGIPLRDLPAPQPGGPTGYRPAEARQHEAWVPNIAWDEFGPNEADFFVGPEANIRRALTLVPNEARSFFDLVTNQYYSREQMLDLKQEFRSISHLQIELLASRVSAINQCTYWTTSHAALLRAGSEVTGDDLDYGAILGGADAGDTGVEYSGLLIELADAVLDTDDTRLTNARNAICDSMSKAALVDAVAVAALFNGIDRIADATGAPLETVKAEATEDLRAEIGINSFGEIKQALDAEGAKSAAE